MKRIMSSWQSQGSVLKNLSQDKLYCRTSTSGYCSNFFNFFFCYLYAQSQKKELYLHDTKNNISKEYHLILDTFKPPAGVTYTILNGITLQQNSAKEMNAYYDSLSYEEKRAVATKLFEYSPPLQRQVDLRKKGLPLFDCGLHIRTGDKITTGEMIAIPFTKYLDAIKQYQLQSGKQTLTIYLMTDSLSVLQYFKEKKESSWTLVSLPPAIPFEKGHDQKTYNSNPTKVKQDAFTLFMTELHILKSCPHIICTFSSNIGRLLDLIRDGTIVSCD
jgi:hypothetical protein